MKLKISLSSSILIVDREGNPTLDVCFLFFIFEKGINKNLKKNYKYPLQVLMIYGITILDRKMKLKLNKILGGFLL